MERYAFANNPQPLSQPWKLTLQKHNGVQFRDLAPELRYMIWDLASPVSKKVVTARVLRTEEDPHEPNHACELLMNHEECIHRTYPITTRRLKFQPEQYYGVPVLLHICQESRHHLLNQGGLISIATQFEFDLPAGREARALWWNFKDILVFDNQWVTLNPVNDDELLKTATGLQNVRNIALTDQHAQKLGYSQVYHNHSIKALFASPNPQADPAIARPLPKAIRLQFEGSIINKVPQLHFVPRFFPSLHTITITFPELCFDIDRRNRHRQPLPANLANPMLGVVMPSPGYVRIVCLSHPRDVLAHYLSCGPYICEHSIRDQVAGECERGKVTFQVDKPGDMETALAKLKKLRELWGRVAWPSCGPGLEVKWEYVRGPWLAVEEGHKVQETYTDGEFKECRALPVVLMGLRKPKKKYRELLC